MLGINGVDPQPLKWVMIRTRLRLTTVMRMKVKEWIRKKVMEERMKGA